MTWAILTLAAVSTGWVLFSCCIIAKREDEAVERAFAELAKREHK